MAVAGGQAQQAVATGSEVASTHTHANRFHSETAASEADLEKRPELAVARDFRRWVLSDGAGAMLLSDTPPQQGPSLRIEWIETLSYANEQPACMYIGAEKQPDRRLRGWRDYPT